MLMWLIINLSSVAPPTHVRHKSDCGPTVVGPQSVLSRPCCGVGIYLYRNQSRAIQLYLYVASWPRGSYLLHIATRAGTTVKKLLLQ